MHNLFKAVFGFLGIIGALSVGVANAATISYSLSGHEGTYYANDLELYFLVNTETLPHHYTIMDRNLGASKVYNQDWVNQNTGSYGYYYKWGNNKGFTASDSAFLSASTGTWVEREQGPCPDGYYIPSVSDWSDIRMDWFTYANRGNRTGAAYDLLLPSAGMRSGAAIIQGGEYRTSSPSGDPDRAYALYLGSEVYNSPIPTRSRSRGGSLRCFKKDFQSGGNLNFYLNGGKKGVIAVSDGKITSLFSPYRDNSVFEGWYTTFDFQTGTKLGVGSGTDGVTDLYAKWGCIEGERYGYVLSGDACERGTKVIFNTNWGVSPSWSITVPYGTVLDFSGGVAKYPDGTTVNITGEVIANSGQTFVGWNTGTNNRTIKTLVIQEGEDYITLNAIYRGDHKITFNATKNGGETETGSISVPYGTLIDLSEYTATKGSSGVRTFLGRNTDSGATSGFPNMYKAENENSDYTTLYAIFRKDKFNVNFETNGHGDTPATQVINRGEKVSNPGDLTTPGYNFEGWSDNEYLTTNFDFGITPTDDVTLYAKWRVPGAECYEGFEYDDNLGMCIKKNEWVIRVGMNGTVLLSSKYSDLVDLYISMQYSGIDLSKVKGIDIAKSYLGVILSAQINNDFLHIDNGKPSNSNGEILEISAGSGEDKELLFTMITNWRCRGEEPDLSCNFDSLDTIKADNISSWDNVSISTDIAKEHTPSELLEKIEWADNIRIIFDPRAFITFDSNGHGNAPAPQFVNKGSRIINPGPLSAVGYNFLGWSEDAYLTSTFDFNAVVDRDTKLYAKWVSVGGYSCPEGQEYDDSVGLCKKPKDWVIRIGYNGDMEFSSGYSLFLDETLLSGLDTEMSESEVEAFKKASGILIATLEILDGTDEIMADKDKGIVPDGDFWLLDYLNKNGKLLFTVVVDRSGTEFTGNYLDLHIRSTYVNVVNNVSSLDNLKLVPSSTGINEYVEAYPSIAQLENLWIVFSDRMEPNIIDNGGTRYSGGGGGHQGGANEDDKIDEHFSAQSQDDTQDSPIGGGEYPTEFQQAYKFAYENGITTMDTIEKADMEGGLTRIAMAKMLSQYAINVLGQKPANIIVPNFSDINSELNEEYDFGVSLAYQLGIMGINIPDNKFRPFDLVTRAEFATALSRMLYQLADGDPYYVTHMAKLKEEGIITNDDPEMLEIRGYVMIMLMRSAK